MFVLVIGRRFGLVTRPVGVAEARLDPMRQHPNMAGNACRSSVAIPRGSFTALSTEPNFCGMVVLLAVVVLGTYMPRTHVELAAAGKPIPSAGPMQRAPRRCRSASPWLAAHAIPGIWRAVI